MKGTFKITLTYLKELGACREGQREFQKAFPDGGEYQEVLDRCAEEGRLDFAGWLFSRVGPTEDVRTYSEDIAEPDKNIFFAGRIEFVGSVFARGIKAGWGIEAGLGIKAGEGIKAGLGIKAGRGIEAGEGIEAGDGYCVFAGLCVPMPHWESLAVVTAKSKPNNLVSGFWRPLEGSNEKTI